MSGVVKGCRTPVADRRRSKLDRQVSDKPQGEETAGRLRRVTAHSMGKVRLMQVAGSDDWDRRRCGEGREAGFELERGDCGADGIAENPQTGTTLILQCKHSQTGANIGPNAIEELLIA